MGFFDDFVDAVEDAGDVVADVAGDVGEVFADTAGDIGSGIGEGFEAAADAAGDVGGYLGDAIGFAGGFVDDASFGLAGGILNLADDVVFDSVDYLSGGVIDVDFDDGTFGANLGIDGLASYGASIGEHGVTAGYSTLVASGDVGLTDQGFNVGASGGIDFGPLPYADGHVNLHEDGTVDVGGHVQGTIPTPIGIVSGEADAGFHRTPDGAWGTNLNLDGQLTLPTGTYVGAGFDFAHEQTADGDNFTSIGGRGSVGQYGVGEVGVEGGYQHIEQDGVTIDRATVGGHASGYGFSAEAEAGYQRAEMGGDVVEDFTAGGSVSGYGMGASGQVGYRDGSVGGRDLSGWSADGDIDVDPAKLAGLGRSLFGEDMPGGMPTDVDGLVGMLGGGGTAELLGNLGGDDLAGFLGALGDGGAADLVGKLAQDGTFGSLLGSADSDSLAGLLGKVANADPGGLGSLLGGLDPETTTGLVSALAGAGRGSGDDMVGDAGGAGAVRTIAAGVDSPLTDELGTIVDPISPDQADLGAPFGDPLADPLAGAVDAGPAVVDDPVGDAFAPEPLDDFSQQIAAADEVESSVDSLFEGLE
jgi:hypothetical protein